MNELEPVQIIHNLMKKREEKLFSNSELIPEVIRGQRKSTGGVFYFIVFCIFAL